ncbi:phage tail sheath subtilisin-like domain-containing protein [Actinobacillus pleuropneumoniae]|uniref:phage tail sheath subtilisin-like domain-containing protein n=1 Tax=Actinobacillus pleuropneumoniae TaxID=715 RepID=UPI003B020348
MTKVDFEQIPNSLRKPGVYTEYNNKDAVTTLPTNEQEVLIIAPMTAEYNQAFTKPIKLFSDVEAEKYFGEGSLAHLMVRQAIKNNPTIRLTVIGLKDHLSGVAAVGNVTLSGTASSNGVISVVIAGQVYDTSVAKGEEASVVNNRLAAVINRSRYSPVIASTEESGKLKLTAKGKGEIGNEIALSVKNNAQGLNAQVTAISGGQRNAQIADALASVAGTHYNVIISAFSDDENATALREHLETMASPIEDKPGIGVMGWRGTFSTGTTFTSNLNSERITVGWYKGAVEPNAIIAAGYGAVIAAEEDPARPLNTLEVKGLTLVDDSEKPLFSEVNQALFNGLSPLEVVVNRVQITRAITTYTKSVTNTDDPSYLDLTTPRTLDYVRKAIQTRQRLRFPRAKNSPRMPAKVRSEVLDVLYQLEGQEIIENVDGWKDRLVVVKNALDPTYLDLDIPADVVNGLHVIRNKITLSL